MAHDHSHEGPSYLLDQLCTVAVCGAIAVVTILMYTQDMLKHILAPNFHLPVLIGGVVLMGIVVIRAITLWGSVGSTSHTHDHGHNHHPHDHDHDHHDHAHGEKCEHMGCDHPHHDHDHAHHDHGHKHDHHNHAHAHTHDHHHHDHDHGWTPVRYMVLLFPILMFFVLPNGGFSEERLNRILGKDADIDGSYQEIAFKEGEVPINLGFKELSQAAYSQQAREHFEGKLGRLKGLNRPINERECTLFRLKMTCCASDAIPLKVRIISKDSISAIPANEWVDVVGQIQFRKTTGKEEYVPVLQLRSAKDIVVTQPDPSVYEY